MDTTRWKSILVPREVYEEIKELSKEEGRTIGGQLRLVFDWYTESKGKRKAANLQPWRFLD
jgi:predicted DNA-binding protein